MDNEKINSELEDITASPNGARTEEAQDSKNESTYSSEEHAGEDIPSEEEASPEDNEAEEENEDEEDTPEEKKRKNLLSVLEVVEIFAVATFAVLFFFSFVFRICTVDGDSMLNTLHHGETLITSDLFYTPKTGDIIIFYEDTDGLQRPLVKRVIATEGQTIEINYRNGTVSVDGVQLAEDYVYLAGGSYIIHGKYYYNPITETMTMTIPEDEVFVMGDNRNNSWDSRSRDIGCISENQIMGQVVCRLSPFTIFN